MNRSVAVHGALLVVALGAAYATWTNASDVPAAAGSAEVWAADSADVSAVRYEGRDKRVVLERKRDDAGSYLWGTSGPASGDSATQFLVGESGEQLVGALAPLRAVRDLGTPSAEEETQYGLAGSTTRLEVEADGEKHELIVGGSVFGSGDRYAKDPATGRTYVLLSTLFPILDSPEALVERRLHAFMDDKVKEVVVHASGGTRTMRRLASDTGPITWAPANAPDRPDQTFATFMDRVQQLWAERYAPDADRASLEELLRIDYVGDRDQPIGYLVLMRREGDTPEYFLVSEHSRVPVRAYAGTAEQLARDVSQIFGGGAAPAAEAAGVRGASVGELPSAARFSG